MMLLFDDETVTKNHDAAIRREAKAEGRAEGRVEGRAEGKEEERLSNIRQVMKKLKYTAQQAMEFLEIPVDAQSEYVDKL